MTLLSQRVFYEQADLTKVVNSTDEQAAMIAYQAGEYIYIGCEVPFNNLWFEMDVPNQLTASPVVEVWSPSKWEEVAEIVDETSEDGASLARSGRMTWQLDWQRGWTIENESFRVEGLETTKIFEMFWLRLSFIGDLSASTSIRHIGQKLCTERDLFNKYPDLAKEDVLLAFDPDKDTWDDQLYLATDDVIRSLKARGKIFHRGQIFDHTVWTMAAVDKTAELIYLGLGQAFENSRVLALREYEKGMKVGYDRIDKNMDGRLSQREKRAHTVYGSR